MPINPKELNIEELKNRIKWLEKGLKDIKGWTRETEIQDVAQAILDGEPTTADEYDEEVQNYGPPYSMANPSGDPKVHKHPLGTGFAQKDKKKEKK